MNDNFTGRGGDIEGMCSIGESMALTTRTRFTNVLSCSTHTAVSFRSKPMSSSGLDLNIDDVVRIYYIVVVCVLERIRFLQKKQLNSPS